MKNVDLVPAESRHKRFVRRWLKVVGISAAAFIAASQAGHVTLKQRAAELKGQAAELQQQQALSEQQRHRLQDLDTRRAQYARKLNMLNGLRSGAAAETVFAAIDRALGDAQVSFVDWQFQRSGVVASASQPAGRDTGYFVINDQGANAQAGDWLVKTHMTIKAHAPNHETVSEFVAGLFRQPEIVDVKVQKTELHRYASAEYVVFDLAIVLNSKPRA